MEEENKNKPNLIKQTISRVANKLHGSKVFKRVGALVIAVAIAASLSACKPNNNKNNGGNTTYVCDECGGNHKTQDHNKQTDVGYSVLMHSVLENADYQALVADYAERSKDDLFYYYVKNQNPNYFCKFNSHPYAFLQKQGYDVEKIKSGELSCQTFTFVKKDEPTKLYMSTRVQSIGKTFVYETPCFDNYLLSYNLSKQEMADYKKVHEQELIYANFMNDAISAQKQETILLKTKTHYSTQLSLFNAVRETSGYYNADECFYVSSNHDKYTIDMIVVNNYNTLTYGTFKCKDSVGFQPEAEDGMFFGYRGSSFVNTLNTKSYELSMYTNTVLKDKSYAENFNNKTAECLGLGEYNPNLTK